MVTWKSLPNLIIQLIPFLPGRICNFDKLSNFPLKSWQPMLTFYKQQKLTSSTPQNNINDQTHLKAYLKHLQLQRMVHMLPAMLAGWPNHFRTFRGTPVSKWCCCSWWGGKVKVQNEESRGLKYLQYIQTFQVRARNDLSQPLYSISIQVTQRNTTSKQVAHRRPSAGQVAPTTVSLGLCWLLLYITHIILHIWSLHSISGTQYSALCAPQRVSPCDGSGL